MNKTVYDLVKRRLKDMRNNLEFLEESVRFRQNIMDGELKQVSDCRSEIEDLEAAIAEYEGRENASERPDPIGQCYLGLTREAG